MIGVFAWHELEIPYWAGYPVSSNVCRIPHAIIDKAVSVRYIPLCFLIVINHPIERNPFPCPRGGFASG